MACPACPRGQTEDTAWMQTEARDGANRGAEGMWRTGAWQARVQPIIPLHTSFPDSGKGLKNRGWCTHKKRGAGSAPFQGPGDPGKQQRRSWERYVGGGTHTCWAACMREGHLCQLYGKICLPFPCCSTVSREQPSVAWRQEALQSCHCLPQTHVKTWVAHFPGTAGLPTLSGANPGGL